MRANTVLVDAQHELANSVIRPSGYQAIRCVQAGADRFSLSVHGHAQHYARTSYSSSAARDLSDIKHAIKHY